MTLSEELDLKGLNDICFLPVPLKLGWERRISAAGWVGGRGGHIPGILEACAIRLLGDENTEMPRTDVCV